MDRSRRVLVGVLWLLIGVTSVALSDFPAGGVVGLGVAGVAGVGYCLIGLAYLLERPRSWWAETE